MINGIPDHILDEMELRLVGADHRPWSISGTAALDDEGRRTIMRCSKKAQNKAIKEASRVADTSLALARNKGEITEAEWKEKREDHMVHAGTISKLLVLFHRTDLATDDMLEFIARAPDDVEALLREVRTLRTMLKTYKEKSEKAISELQTSKIAASRAEQKIVDMRRAWRTLVKEMGVKI